MKPGRAAARRYGRTVSTQDIPTPAHTQTSQVYAGAEVSAGRHAAYHGQRRHVLRAARSVHLHLQVSQSRCLPAAMSPNLSP